MAEKQIDERKKSTMPKSEKATAKGKNNKKSASITIIVVLLVVTIIAMGVMIVTKNLFGGRDEILNYLTSLDPAYETLQERESGLIALEEDLMSREESVIKKETVLATEEAELEKKAEASQQEAVNSSFELYVASLSEERIAQIEQLSTIYSNMEVEQAAATLSKIESPVEMAIVIYYMAPEFSAGILNLMDVKLTAQITESLLK